MGLSNTCLGGAASCGTQGEACCNGALCGDNLACNADMTCTCGGTGEPCCDGTTCDGTNTCSSGVCACGGIGEPCCDGSTCNTGLSCGGDAVCTGGATQVGVGWFEICALRTDKTVSCWGRDTKSYAMGVPGWGVPAVNSTTPVTVAGITDAEELRVGDSHVCARKSDKTLWCWGQGGRGQLGNGTTVSSATAIQVPDLTDVSLFDLGRTHTCALGSYQGVSGLWCWGRNGEGGDKPTKPVTAGLGRLGNDSTVDSPVPVAVDIAAATAGGKTIRGLAVGAFHTCISTSDSRVWCWGDNAAGALGIGTLKPTQVPVAVDLSGITVPPGITLDEVAASAGWGNQSCLRLSNGSVYCWGQGSAGELGDGTAALRTAPSTPVTTDALGSAKLVEISLGYQYACGRADDGTVWCWGRNKRGVLGIDDAVDAPHTTPVQVVGLSGIRQIAAGHRTACAIDDMQRLFCWGSNRRGQVTLEVPATDTDGQVLAPTQVNL
jgi:alpha-tubulin suppressor-like RCC1 family protein